jgi:hypothetical protein
MFSAPLSSSCPAYAQSHDESKENAAPTTSMRMKDGG